MFNYRLNKKENVINATLATIFNCSNWQHDVSVAILVRDDNRLIIEIYLVVAVSILRTGKTKRFFQFAIRPFFALVRLFCVVLFYNDGYVRCLLHGS